jgi:glycosyltransferase involved in cell wall biosynthesis
VTAAGTDAGRRTVVLHCRCSNGHYGPEQALDQLMPALADCQVEPRVLAIYRRPVGGPPIHPWVSQLRERGHQAEQILDPSPLSLDVVRQVARRLGGGDCDVLHTHDYRSNLLGGLAARRQHSGIPWVATVHLHTGATRRLRLYRTLDLFLLRLADRVVTVSRDQGRMLARRGVEPRRLVLVPNVIDAARFAARAGDSARTRAALDLPVASPVIGAVGRLAYQKGFDLLLEAMAAVRIGRPDCQLLIAGDGPARPALELQAGAMGLGASVRFLGYVSDVAPLMSACDAIALPSRSEGMPLVLLEALALARPVVAARVGGVSEVVHHEETGLLVAPGSVPELAAAVLRLVSEPDLAARLGAAGAARVRLAYQPPRAARKLALAYEEVLAERVEGPSAA